MDSPNITQFDGKYILSMKSHYKMTVIEYSVYLNYWERPNTANRDLSKQRRPRSDAATTGV